MIVFIHGNNAVSVAKKKVYMWYKESSEYFCDVFDSTRLEIRQYAATLVLFVARSDPHRI